jgi:cytochrome c-type biogenesis protein CcmH
MVPGRKVAAAVFAAFCLWAGVAVADAPPAQGAHHVAATGDDAARFDEYVPGANRLEGRIRAPCCWNQTIDIHGSEVAQALRREIRTRLRAGETADTIEASIVARYGERVLAVPPGSPLKKVAVALALLLVAAGLGAGRLVMRWRRDALRAPESPTPSQAAGKDAAGRDALDERLDAELRALGD